MLELEPSGSFADLGCGSGVLAIAAAMLGFGPVTAVDNELAALEATRANAAANGVALDTRGARQPARASRRRRRRTVAANLMRPLLLQLAGRHRGRGLDPLRAAGRGGRRGGGGIRPRREERRLAEGGWAALLLL